MLAHCQNTFEGMDLKPAQEHLLQKMHSLFFLGQLLGLPTLQSILTKFGIQSNGLQVKYKKLCKQLSLNKIRRMYDFVFESQVEAALQKMSEKDSSAWSRELVTLVLDDSIFRQWLQSQNPVEDFEGFYGRFFSGQYKAAVSGFKVLTLALSIDGILYPLYFDFVKYAPKEAPKVEKAVEVAQKLLKRWGDFKTKLQAKGIEIPRLHLSCDNGYSDKTLAEVCTENDLIYISVPKKSHYFEVDGQKMKLSDWIEKVFLDAEKQHLETSSAPFTFRFRAKYVAQDKEQTLLAFRLNGSNKVSVIYSPDKSIFAKTLRRHWFQRTYIAQFFKMLKHVLQITEARVRTKEQFETKLFRFAFLAFHAQVLVRFLRKKMKDFAKMGFIALQRILNSDPDFLDLLQSYL